jgi:hypothetical protein
MHDPINALRVSVLLLVSACLYIHITRQQCHEHLIYRPSMCSTYVGAYSNMYTYTQHAYIYELLMIMSMG